MNEWDCHTKKNEWMKYNDMYDVNETSGLFVCLFLRKYELFIILYSNYEKFIVYVSILYTYNYYYFNLITQMKTYLF